MNDWKKCTRELIAENYSLRELISDMRRRERNLERLNMNLEARLEMILSDLEDRDTHKENTQCA